MPKKGLTRDLIIDTALRMTEEKGPFACSMRELADALDVKAASLYNHISGMDDLMSQVGLRAAQLRASAQLEAIRGKTRDEALFALADAYRAFAGEHANLDRAIMGLQRELSPILPQAEQLTLRPILQVLDSYGLDEEAKLHWQRILRAVLHGFCVHEHIGVFNPEDGSTDESYRIAIQCLADGLRAAGTKA